MPPRFALPIATVAALAALSPGTALAVECTRQVDDVTAAGPALRQPVTLRAAAKSEQRLVNFGTGRGIKVVRDVELAADKRLPAGVTPSRLGFRALIERSDGELETVDFTDPTFTQPRISADRRRITFSICLSAAGLGAGKYVGTVTVSGPEGLGEASVGVTANLKGRFLIWGGIALVAMLLAGLALYFKDRTSRNITQDGTWWFKTIGTLIVTFGALLAVYLSDPAWGADPLRAGLALVSTALASIGGRKLLE